MVCNGSGSCDDDVVCNGSDNCGDDEDDDCGDDRGSAKYSHK